MKPRTSGSSSMTRIDSGASGTDRAGRLVGCRPRPRSTSLVGLAEQQLDRGALARRAFDPRGAARLARHAIDHRQAEAGALADFLGGEEGLERALEHFGRHADAGVADGELDIVAVLEVGVAADAAPASADEGQHAAVGHCVAGVDREVEHRDLELGRIGHHRHHRLVEIELLGDPGAEHVAQQRPHVLDQRRDDRSAAPRAAAPG